MLKCEFDHVPELCIIVRERVPELTVEPMWFEVLRGCRRYHILGNSQAHIVHTDAVGKHRRLNIPDEIAVICGVGTKCSDIGTARKYCLQRLDIVAMTTKWIQILQNLRIVAVQQLSREREHLFVTEVQELVVGLPGSVMRVRVTSLDLLRRRRLRK